MATLLITGGTRGIGAAVARHAVGAGWLVHVWGRSREAGEALVNALGPDRCVFRPVDISDHALLEREYAWLAARHRLTHAFNNAGVAAAGTLTEIEVETVQRCLETNVFGLWANLKFQLTTLAESRSGAIVNNLSIHALRPVFGGVAVYAASKAAGAMLTQAAALEAGPAGVRVNGIAPGPIDTALYQASLPGNRDAAAWPDRIPLGRIGSVDEVARLVLFLLSPAASYINGQIVGIDGGASCA